MEQDLSDLSNTLSSRLASLESKYTSVSEELAFRCPVVNPTTSHHSDSSTSPSQLSRQPSSSPKRPKVSSAENRKFNLIVSGVPEAPEGQARLSRVNHDFERVFSIFSELLDTSIGPPVCIRDCRRLGRFQRDSESSRSRLVLVTPDLVLAVNSILSKVASAGSRSVRIRRDLSLEARLAHSLLMKERRKLIDSGVERSDIVLQRTNLFVKGNVYGTFHGDTFKLASASASLLHPVQNLLQILR